MIIYQYLIYKIRLTNVANPPEVIIYNVKGCRVPTKYFTQLYHICLLLPQPVPIFLIWKYKSSNLFTFFLFENSTSGNFSIKDTLYGMQLFGFTSIQFVPEEKYIFDSIYYYFLFNYCYSNRIVRRGLKTNKFYM